MPPQILAAAITLQALHGLSDFETVQELRCDLRWKAACGLHTRAAALNLRRLINLGLTHPVAPGTSHRPVHDHRGCPARRPDSPSPRSSSSSSRSRSPRGSPCIPPRHPRSTCRGCRRREGGRG
ncbi:transposase [Streptomyces hebeiensis]|uniref:transposase n=1 Tax=Streptomyces hebeiensis TaxID=229486 RepID=UPI003CD0A7D0